MGTKQKSSKSVGEIINSGASILHQLIAEKLLHSSASSCKKIISCTYKQVDPELMVK